MVFGKNKKFIEFKELIPIAIACTVWGEELRNKRVLFHCDNTQVVSVINNKTSSNDHIMILVRYLVLACLRNNIMVRAKYVESTKNVITDALSRFLIQKFRQLAPYADFYPTPIPKEFQQFCQI